MQRQTERMTWVPIHAGQDHLQQFTRRSAIDALAELIWNGLDAEADTVDVGIEISSVAGGSQEFFHVTRITITDNGHGITPEKASEAFPSLGDSWKRHLSGRTVNGKRPLHGSRGRGRFFAYSLGNRARWSSVAAVDDGFRRIEIEGDQARIDGFTIGEPQLASGATGTTVAISVEQGRPLAALTRDDVPLQLAARLAAHLLGNPDITVRINGRKVDPDRSSRGTQPKSRWTRSQRRSWKDTKRRSSPSSTGPTKCGAPPVSSFAMCMGCRWLS